MLKCFAELKQEGAEKYKNVINEGLKQPGGASWLVVRTFAELESIADTISDHGVGFDARAVMLKLLPAERHLVDNMLRYTSAEKRNGWRASFKVNAQRSGRFVSWMAEHEQDLADLAELQIKCNRKAPPNMDERKQDLESLLN